MTKTKPSLEPLSKGQRHQSRPKAAGFAGQGLIFERLLFQARAASDAGPEAQLAAADGLFTQTQIALTLLEAMRMAARLEAGVTPDHPSPNDLTALANRAIRTFELAAQDQSIQLRVHPGDLGQGHAPRGVIEMLVKACVGMGLLACPSGGAVDVLTAQADNRVELEVKVTETARARKKASNGPVRMMDGQLVAAVLAALAPLADPWGIEITDRSPSESEFDLLLSVPAWKLPSGAIQAGKILIVDDDPDGAFLLEQVLAKASFEVEIATNGLEGLAMAKAPEIALVLLDVMLPGMDGYEVCHQLRKGEATSRLPIVMISAKARPEDRAMGEKVGADAYMVKPLRLNEVIQTVQGLLSVPQVGPNE